MAQQILSFIIQNLVVRATGRPVFVHPCLKYSSEFGDVTYSSSYKNGGSRFLQDTSNH
jgi:hypothetical protein